MTARVSISLSLLILAMVSPLGCNSNDQSARAPATPPQNALPSPAPLSAGAPASAADSDSVTQAVEDHLRTNKGINMSAMDMTIDSVSVDGDHAQANATFRVKGGGAAMAMVYSLGRRGNGWLVLKSQPSNGEFIHPPMDKVHSRSASTAPAPPSGVPDVTEFLKSHSSPKNN
jgi:hypothetical protein